MLCFKHPGQEPRLSSTTSQDIQISIGLAYRIYNLFIKYSYIANPFKQHDIVILINLINRKHTLLKNKSCRSYFDGNIDSCLKERLFNVANYTRWDKL